MARSALQQIGDAGEQQALEHLLEAGLVLVARQASNRLGEIDLIMREGDELVFVEVRRRRRTDYGGAAASVTPAKQRRVLRAAQVWLQAHCGDRWPACRFDVCAIDGHSIEWIRGAFCL